MQGHLYQQNDSKYYYFDNIGNVILKNVMNKVHKVKYFSVFLMKRLIYLKLHWLWFYDTYTTKL